MYKKHYSSKVNGLKNLGSAALFILAFNVSTYIHISQYPLMTVVFFFFSVYVVSTDLSLAYFELSSKDRWSMQIDQYGVSVQTPSERVAKSFKVRWSEVENLLRLTPSDAKNYAPNYCLVLKTGETIRCFRNSPFDSEEAFENMINYSRTRLEIRRSTLKELRKRATSFVY